MKKFTLIFTYFFLIYECSAQKIINFEPKKEFKETQKNIYIPQQRKVETASKELYYPYLHINGFKDYEITKKEVPLLAKEKIKVSEISFNATYSSFYTRKVMFDNFGDWNKGLFLKKSRFPLLIWEDIKLLKNSDELFTVIAGGFEDTNGLQLKSKVTKNNHSIYSSIIVLDSNGNDYLAGNRPHKKDIINFFANGIKNLDNSLLFYTKFHYWTKNH